MPAGRPAKPAAIKQLTKPTRKKDSKAVQSVWDAEPTANDYETIPDPRTLWNNLSACGVVKLSDRLAFARYESTYAILVKANKDIKERGLILHKDTQNECYNPSWRIWRDCCAILSQFEKEFGLTPAAKRGITQPLSVTEKPADQEDWYDKTRREQWANRHAPERK